MRKWWPLTAVGLGAFMLLIDVTIVNVALPDMTADLGASFADLQWVADIYALTLAALLLGIGALGDRLGHRRVYIAGLAIFGLASLGCALAPSTALLITGRAVQGVGAVAMFAANLALLSTAYQGRDRAVAFRCLGIRQRGCRRGGPDHRRPADPAGARRALFRNRTFVGLVTAAALLSVGAWAMFPYASLWMQSSLGLGPGRDRPGESCR
jgi:predicted MFS family arabinose efflux permease